jgi:hypothetical protein
MELTQDIAATIRTARFSYADEHDLQAGISEALTDVGISFQREVRMGTRDRIDFLVGTVGIEIKVASNVESVLRQLHRYAEWPTIDKLILITTRATHLSLPRIIGNKPVEVIFMGGVR